MLETKDYFPSFIGQSSVKNKLTHYINSHRKTSFFPSCVICATRGSGKTEIVHHIGKNLLNCDGYPKEFYEMNGASVKSLRAFIDDVIVPHVIPQKECTIFIDEIHLACDDVKGWLLAPLNPTDTNQTRAEYRGQTIDFDFTKLTFLSATTNPEKLSKPLNSRLKRIEFKRYSDYDLEKILKLKIRDIKFPDGAEKWIVSICRGNPRLTVEISKDVKSYCAVNGQDYFSRHDFKNFSQILDINPLGLTSQEMEYLNFLNERGSQTLTAIASFLGLDPKTVRGDIEPYLHYKNLLRIDGTREITQHGRVALKEKHE
jgi:Holliday junction resolvasome RuvABC ATP-dependent DNA helicase subunit